MNPYTYTLQNCSNHYTYPQIHDGLNNILYNALNNFERKHTDYLGIKQSKKSILGERILF